MRKLAVIAVALIGALVAGVISIRGGLLLGSDLSRDDCIEDVAGFEASLEIAILSDSDLPRARIVASGLDRDLRSESRFACEVGFGSSDNRDLDLKSVTVERYASRQTADEVFQTTEPGQVIEPYSEGRVYRDLASDTGVDEALQPGVVTTFTSLHLVDCLIVRVRWYRPVTNELLLSAEGRNRWIQSRVASMSTLCQDGSTA